LQDAAEEIIAEQVDQLGDLNARNGALVAIRPLTGEILAMVGSADFYEEDIDGQVNMAVAPRQPGSSIKPLTYVAAFEKGWTPATLIWDVPSEFPPSGRPDDTRPPYEPVNYDERFHGPVTVRTALANSYNVPAVKAIDFVKIYDDPDTPQPDGLINLASRLGITSLTRDDYGLSLTLGGGEVSLLELTDVYAVLANGGRRVPPIAITRIVDFNGNLVYENTPQLGDQVIRPEHAFLISSILSDNEARTPAFGPDSLLNLPFQVAAKTGTTNDFRDNWTLGYVPELAVGVWVGNADYTPMQNVTGLTGAAPIWSEFMRGAVQQLTGDNPSQFARPAGVVERVICAISGTEPSDRCPSQRSEFFAADQPPLPKGEDLWKRVEIDTWTGLEASGACDEFTDDSALSILQILGEAMDPPEDAGRAWAEDNGFDEPVFFVPDRPCTADDPPAAQFASPCDGDTISETPFADLCQSRCHRQFQALWLEYGQGDDPVDWDTLTEDGSPVNDRIRSTNGTWLTCRQALVTLRLTVYGEDDNYAELKIRLNLQVPTPTPTPTPTFTPTPTLTQTPVPTTTPTPTPNTPLPPTPSPTGSSPVVTPGGTPPSP
jgi:membrane peptidoglycan carboxypeptidase